MVTNKTYPRVSEICILSCYLQNVLPRKLVSIFLWPKPAWVSFRCLRNLPFHPSSVDSAVLFKVEFGVQSTNAPGFAVGSISVTFLLSLRCDLACGASRVVGTWARMCRGRHGGCVQVGAEAELPLLQCNKGILLLEPSRKKLTQACLHQQLLHSLCQDRQAKPLFWVWQL